MSIGETLAQAREKTGLTVTQVSAPGSGRSSSAISSATTSPPAWATSTPEATSAISRGLSASIQRR